MIVRVRGPPGQSRFDVSPNEALVTLFEKVAEKWQITSPFKLSRTPDGTSDFTPTMQSRSFIDIGIKHGDQLYLLLQPGSKDASASGPELDRVDVVLDQQDGLVARKRDPAMCHHSDTNKCIHCTPLQPFDETVLAQRDPPIKFLSFHTYLRKLKSGADQGRLISLQEIKCAIDKECKSCPGYPKGVCSRCQPSAVRLTRQIFRHVDYLSFDSGAMVQEFIDAWLKSGKQRYGVLFGDYAEYTQVPLGIQARVSAIYEPPQVSEADGFELQDHEAKLTSISAMAKLLGLRVVGCIYTDLETDPTLKPPNNVKHTRFVSEDNTVFMGAEILNAAVQQMKYPNAVASKYSLDGVYGSKFVTCVVSGGSDNAIQLHAYQATNDTVAMMRADILRPSATRVNEVCVKESDEDTYVPEVMYQMKNEYGLETTVKASPTIPSDYLFTQLEVGSAMAARADAPLQGDGSSGTFVIGNRQFLGTFQDLPALGRHLGKTKSLIKALSNFHVLVYLWTNDMVPMADDMPPLLHALKSRDVAAVEQWAASCERYQTLCMLMREINAGGVGSSGTAGASAPGGWQCRKCTFINEGNPAVCNMCASPP
eukprot:m.731867 g.731867  ORF g.731867 m.731867 type:complete len:595 (-) comp23063_c0_seq1:1732-3516(-)